MLNLKVVCGLLYAVAGMARAAEDQVAADASWVPARYDFNYAVNDPLTGDLKDQQETRSGDDVAGFYRTLDADGFVRTVRYQADAVNGFRADVVREPVPGGAVVATAPDSVAKATGGASVKPAVVHAPAAYHPAAYYRGLSPAYLPYSPNAAYHQPYLPYAAYLQPYLPYAAYQPHSAHARLLQPYSPYAAAYQSYTPYQPFAHGGPRYPLNDPQYANVAAPLAVRK